jgi:putative endonuclease
VCREKSQASVRERFLGAKTALRNAKGRHHFEHSGKSMTKNYYAHIMTNKSRTFYTGITNNLERRVSEHKQKLIEGFTKRYNITVLVHFEVFSDVRDAIAREKQVKDWRREKKIALIESMNPTWRDLSEDWSK